MKFSLSWRTGWSLLILLVCLGLLIRSVSSSEGAGFQHSRVLEVVSKVSVGELGNGEPGYTQQLRLSDPVNDVVTLGSTFQPLAASQLLAVGQRVVVAESEAGFEVVTVDRVPLIAVLVGTFIIGVWLVAGRRGWYALVGMIFTVTVLFHVTLPWLLAGQNALITALVSAGIIGLVTTYLTHGWQRTAHQTIVSLLSTLCVVLGASLVVMWWARLSGLGSDEAFVLQYLPLAGIDLRGLLLGGIMLGTLGILDDVIIAQVSVVNELKKLDASLSPVTLFRKSMHVGQDHLASLVNTLILAYLGANLPLLLLLGISQDVPWWVMLSQETLTEEVVRTLVGSLGVLLSVPLATLIAVYWPSNLTSALSARTSSTLSSLASPTASSPNRKLPKRTRNKRKTS